MSAEKIAVLASGGLDSSILIAKLAADAEVHPIYVRCGLKWEDAELAMLQSFLGALRNRNVGTLTVLSAPTAAIYGDHWSISGANVPAADQPDEDVFLPGRNIILIGLAAAWCSTHQVSRIAIGSLGGNPFPDATPEFFAKFADALSVGLGHRIQIEAPLRGFHKEDIVRTYASLPLELTLTCMAPNEGVHCGQCNKCNERQQGFRKAGVVDRTVYAG